MTVLRDCANLFHYEVTNMREFVRTVYPILGHALAPSYLTLDV